MRKMLNGISKFGLLSITSFVVNIGLTVFLHEVIGLVEEVAYPISLIVVFLINFVSLRHFVYDARSGSIRKQFATFLLSSLGFRGSEYLTFLLIHTWIGIRYTIAIVAISTTSAFVKFFYYKIFVFTARPKAGIVSSPRSF